MVFGVQSSQVQLRYKGFQIGIGVGLFCFCSFCWHKHYQVTTVS